MAYATKNKSSTRKLANSTKLAKKHAKVMKESKPGTGKRFSSMTELLKAKGAKSPKALAAWIGRRKYGAKKMASMAAKGRNK